MSVDRSLKSKSTLERHRNVLSRAERLAVLQDTERWKEGDPVHGLPKVAHRKAAVGKKAKTEKKSVEGAEAAPAAGAAAPAPAAEAAPAKAAPAKKEGGKPAKT